MRRDDVKTALTGPIASVYIPFHQDGAIDYHGLRALLDASIHAGSGTVLLTYGNSLFSVLTDQEVADITKVVVEHTAKRAMVVAADRSWWTGKTVAFAQYCASIGADMLMALPPSWGASCTADSLVAHYTAVAGHIPVMVVTGLFIDNHSLGLETIRRLRDTAPGVMAVKDDVCGAFGQQLSLLVNDHWGLLSGGRMQNHLDMWTYGCDGYLSTFILFAPHISRRYWDAIQREDLTTATRIIADYEMPYFEWIMSLPGGFDAGIHATFELFGLASRWRRPPYHSLTDAEMERLRAFLTSKGLL